MNGSKAGDDVRFSRRSGNRVLDSPRIALSNRGLIVCVDIHYVGE